MKSPKEKLTDQLIEKIEQFYSQLRLESNEDWPDTELTLTQLRALMLLERGPYSMRELAGHMGITPPSMSVIIERLVDRGLVERSSLLNDRRVVVCLLTRKGCEELENFWSIGHSKIVEITRKLPTEDITMLVKAVEMLMREVEGEQILQ